VGERRGEKGLIGGQMEIRIGHTDLIWSREDMFSFRSSSVLSRRQSSPDLDIEG
jgi:hypothetical protein